MNYLSSIDNKKNNFFYLASINVSSTTVWAENATTVAGFGNGSSGSSNISLNNPRGITIMNDILYIGDWRNCRVVMIDLVPSKVKGIIGSGCGNGITQFESPNDVVTVGTSLYILDSFNSRVQKWSINGTNPSNVVPSGAIGRCLYMSVNKYGFLYLSDVWNHTVVRIAPNSWTAVTVAGTGEPGLSPSQLTAPDGTYIDDNRNLYIADHDNHRIQMWTEEATVGRTVAGNGTAGASLRQLNYPTFVIVDKNDYMYITDEGNNRVLRWKLNSTSGVCIVGCTNAAGTKMNQLNTPVSLAF